MVHFQDESYALRECICLKQVHHRGMTMNGEKKGIEKIQKKIQWEENDKNQK